MNLILSKCKKICRVLRILFQKMQACRSTSIVLSHIPKRPPKIAEMCFKVFETWFRSQSDNNVLCCTRSHEDFLVHYLKRPRIRRELGAFSWFSYGHGLNREKRLVEKMKRTVYCCNSWRDVFFTVLFRSRKLYRAIRSSFTCNTETRSVSSPP